MLLKLFDSVLQLSHMLLLAVSGSLSGGCKKAKKRNSFFECERGVCMMVFERDRHTSIANHASQFTFLLGHARMRVERIEGEVLEVMIGGGLVNFRRLGVEQGMDRFAFDEGRVI